MNTGQIIKVLRTMRGLSQVELATELEISRAYLSQIESGTKEPGMAVLKKVSRFFSIPLALLVVQEDETHPEIMDELRKMLGDILSSKFVSQHKGPQKAGAA